MRSEQEEFSGSSEFYKIVDDCETRFLDGAGNAAPSRNAQNPHLFVFLGDKILESFEIMKNILEQKWNNSKNISYIGISAENLPDSLKNTELKYYSGKKLKYFHEDYVSRVKITKSFETDENIIKSINGIIDSAYTDILGYKFEFMRKVSVAVCCYADDPLNILLPDITILIKNKFKELYPSVDLFVCIDDKNYSPISYAFFQELDLYQNKNFSYKKKIMHSGEFITSAAFTDSVMFDDVYLLGSQNYDRKIPDNIVNENYQLIALINYIKNENSFKSLPYKDSFLYSTAGVKYVSKPVRLMSIKMFSSFTEYIYSLMTVPPETGDRDVFSLLNIDYETALKNVKLPFVSNDDYLAVMHTHENYDFLTRYSRDDILYRIYNGNLDSFFQANIADIYIKNVEKAMENISSLKYNLLNAIKRRKINLSEINDWLKIDGKLVSTIHDALRAFKNDIGIINGEISELLKKKPVLKKGYYRALSETAALLTDAFAPVFIRKLETLKIQAAINLFEGYEAQIPELRTEFMKLNMKMNGICGELNRIYIENAEKSDYASAANMERYKELINEIAKEYEMKKGEDLFNTVLSSLNLYTSLMEDGQDVIAKKLYSFFASVFFNFSATAQTVIRMPFDSDIKNRGIRDELLKNITEPCVLNLSFVSTSDRAVRYKAYMGSDTEFIHGVVESERQKFGDRFAYVEEKNRIDGIEKLDMYTGLQLEDLSYLATCKEIYIEALSIGYEFHREETANCRDLDVLKY